MVTLRHLSIFVSLYENNGNMTKTAESCYLAQPAISLALSELEDYYEVKLFDRISRRLHKNQSGTLLYGYAKRIMNMLEDMDQGMKNSRAYSILRVGCCDSMDACGLPKYVSGYSEIHPGVTVRSTVDTTESLITKVLNNELDVAIVDKNPGNRKIVSEEFIASKLALGVSPSFGYEDGQELTLEEFVKLPVLLREKGCGTRMVFDRAMEEHGYHMEPVYESVGTGYAVNAALSGMGVAVLPEKMMIRYRKKGRLVFIKVKDLDMQIMYRIIYHSDKQLTKTAKDFIEMCRDFESDPQPEANAPKHNVIPFLQDQAPLEPLPHVADA